MSVMDMPRLKNVLYISIHTPFLCIFTEQKLKFNKNSPILLNSRYFTSITTNSSYPEKFYSFPMMVSHNISNCTEPLLEHDICVIFLNILPPCPFKKSLSLSDVYYPKATDSFLIIFSLYYSSTE